MFLTALSALLVVWIAVPIYEKKNEVENLAELVKLVDEANSPLTGMIGGSFSVNESIPEALRASTRYRFHRDETISRVTWIRVQKKTLTPEIIERLLKFRFLQGISLDGTDLTDEQCREFGQLPNLHVIDCSNTPVSYDTLLEMRRRNPRLCHLAHRRALAELSTVCAWPHADDNSPVPDDISIAITPITRRERILPGFKYVGRPIHSAYVSLYDLDDLRSPFWQQFADARSDFHFDFQLRVSPPYGDPGSEFVELSHDDFLRLSDERVGSIELSNLETTDVFDLDRSASYSALVFSTVGPKLIKTFATAHVKDLTYASISNLSDDWIPVSVERLHIDSCGSSSELDLSRCKNLRTLRINGRWSVEQLTGLLELPSLKEVVFRFSEKTSKNLVALFKRKGVNLVLEPVAHGLPMQSPLPLDEVNR